MERRHTPIPARRRPVTELELAGQHMPKRAPAVRYVDDEGNLLFIANDGEELPVLE